MKTYVVVHSFLFYQQKHSPLDVLWEFSQIFLNTYFKEHFGTAASEIMQESSRDSFLLYIRVHSQEMS